MSYTIGSASLRKVCPTLSVARARELAPLLGDAMRAHDITTRRRAAHFISQVAHESGEFRWSSEIWGPTAIQAGYWHRRDLGNWLPWHGKGYRGRGYIQITGRANYKAVSKGLGRDFLGGHAGLLATPRWAAQGAAWWWQHNGCNQLADTDSVYAVTRRVNGGTNGLADRESYHQRAAAVARYLVPRKVG